MSFPIHPYKRTPVAPTVCLLEPDGSCLDEHGDPVDLDNMPPGYRVWCSYDTARLLLMEGRGEALRWNHEEIRWRHRTRSDEHDWLNRASDIYVLKLPFPERAEESLAALARWRDWLAR